MQNEPNLQNTKTSLNPYPKKHYARISSLRPRKNKPNSNPIQPTPTARIDETNPIQPQYAIRHTLPTTQTPAPTLSPKSTQPQPAADQFCAKTQRNHHLIMQNKPNPKNTKTNLTLFPTKPYEGKPPRPTQKNKPKTNPIKPNPTAPRNKTNPIQTHSNPILTSPKLPTPPKSTIRYPRSATRCTLSNPAENKIPTPFTLLAQDAMNRPCFAEPGLEPPRTANRKQAAPVMSDPVEKAKKFLTEDQAFRLGQLLTESFHPKTRNLSQVASTDLPAAIRMLQSVDKEIPPAIDKVLRQPIFADLVETLLAALQSGNRIYFTGCGATGRLSILLEAAWRRFWRQNPDISAKMPEMHDRTISVMAGGDFALIKSVEGFEDFPSFGRRQLREAGVESGDVVVAITEGGETPFVIGTAWQALEAGAKVFFIYNNPTETLRTHVQRSREIIDDPRIKKLDLTTGPMAITGSTRMQATTAELLIVGAALEIALIRLLADHFPDQKLAKLGLHRRNAADYGNLFATLLNELSSPAAVDAMARATQFEENIYRQHGLITYITDSALLDVLTDTTERSPTFMLPPFRKSDDSRSPQPWAFVKHPLYPTQRTWREMLQREPRGLNWGAEVYKELNAPPALKANPPRLDNSEIQKFQIGSEPDTTRTEALDSALVVIAVGRQTSDCLATTLQKFAPAYRKNAAITIGATAPDNADEAFEFDCQLPPSPLRLWHHLAVKLVLNTISTATMVRMGRVIGNAMVWLSPSNKKLIDRGCRLIAQQTGSTYENACIELHKAIAETEPAQKRGDEVYSPVAIAIERIQAKDQ